ncbi:MAG TPA: hypothetical protein VLF09_03255 [Cellvibrio sp.]|nr:hypothetical protein [Cellvibrio sp.]
MTTPLLDITEVANNQVNQYLTVNEAIRALESAGNDGFEIDLSSGDATILADDLLRAFMFVSSGNAVARVITVPAKRRAFAVQNAGTATLKVKRGSAEIDVRAGTASFFYMDGTANGLIVIAGDSGAGGGSVPSPVGEITGTTYDVLDADVLKYLYFTSASAKTVNVRPDSTHALPTDYELNIRNSAASNLTIVAGSGVTIVPPAGGTLVVPPHGTVTLKRVALNVFHLMGVVVPV